MEKEHDFLVRSTEKFPEKDKASEKVVPFSRWKLPNGKFVFHLQISRLLFLSPVPYPSRSVTSAQASLGSLEWNLWQMERAFPKRKFPIENFRNFL